jgi:hypothetical protein
LNGRIYIELINGPMLFEHKATPAEYSAGLKLAIERAWLEPHRSGTFVRFTQAGADLFARRKRPSRNHTRRANVRSDGVLLEP